jgi:hypothetical protein
MRPDSAIRLVFGAASAARKATRIQPDTVGTALQHVRATIESTSRRVSEGTSPLSILLVPLYYCPIGFDNGLSLQCQARFKIIYSFHVCIKLFVFCFHL